MIQLRSSQLGDEPRLRELWRLAFGDEEGYIHHFFQGYYRPERMLVLTQDGVVQAMTAWFDMPLVDRWGKQSPAAYLYAVATHPDARGKGYAGQLLDFAGRWLKERGFEYLTTVPARPDLHGFFERYGFCEYFVLEQWTYRACGKVLPAQLAAVDAQRYGALREMHLAGAAHVAYTHDALAYQQGICSLSGGGLYCVGEEACLCVEVGPDGVTVKELLADTGEYEPILEAVAQRYPGKECRVRTPHTGQGESWEFAMIRPLEGGLPKGDISYLGLAFD